MAAYLVRRLLATIVLLFVIVTVVFLLVHILPGDPALTILGGIEAEPSAAAVERMREQLGLDRPLYMQYFQWLADIVRLDLGTSFVTGRSVTSDLATRMYRSLLIVLPAEVLAVSVGIPLGVASARRRHTRWDPIASAVALIGFSIPVFISGVILILIVSVNLQLLPSGGYVAPQDDFIEFVKRAILPIIALSIGSMAVIMRMTRSSVLEQLGRDYVITARSKGIRERHVVYRHVLRNSLLPVVTVIGLQLGSAFAGTLIVETVFNWPGVGRFLIDAIGTRDYPVVQGVVLVIAGTYVIVNFLTDMTFGILDPRIRYD